MPTQEANYTEAEMPKVKTEVRKMVKEILSGQFEREVLGAASPWLRIFGRPGAVTAAEWLPCSTDWSSSTATG